MGKRLQIDNVVSDRDRVLMELSYRNHQVLIIRRTIPSVKDVLLEWTNDRSPMIINVSQGRGWLKVLFSTGTMVTFEVERPERVDRYSLVINEVT